MEKGLHRLRFTSGYATALRRGSSRSALFSRLEFFLRCHCLAPWSFTLTATRSPGNLLSDATALRRGSSRSPLLTRLEISLRCHGLAPWSLTLTAISSRRHGLIAIAQGRG